MDYIIVGWRFDLKLETYIKDWGLPFHTLRIAILLVRLITIFFVPSTVQHCI